MATRPNSLAAIRPIARNGITTTPIPVIASSKKTKGSASIVSSAARIVKPGRCSIVSAHFSTPRGKISAISTYKTRNAAATIHAHPAPLANDSRRPFSSAEVTQAYSQPNPGKRSPIEIDCTPPRTSAPGSRCNAPPTTTTWPLTTAFGPRSTLPITATTSPPTGPLTRVSPNTATAASPTGPLTVVFPKTETAASPTEPLTVVLPKTETAASPVAPSTVVLPMIDTAAATCSSLAT